MLVSWLGLAGMDSPARPVDNSRQGAAQRETCQLHLRSLRGVCVQTVERGKRQNCALVRLFDQPIISVF
jgi:hypothetical protein